MFVMGITRKINYSNKISNVRKAAFVGTFNPLHDGHVWIIQEALKDFDQIYVVVAQNPDKPITNLDYVAGDVYKDLKSRNCDFSRVCILVNKGLTADYMNKLDTNVIVRGYRNKEDWKYEMMLKDAYLSRNPNLQFIYYKSPRNLRKISSHKK